MKRDVAVNIAVGCVLAAEGLKTESKKEIIDLIRLLDPVPVVWEGDDESDECHCPNCNVPIMARDEMTYYVIPKCCSYCGQHLSFEEE